MLKFVFSNVKRALKLYALTICIIWVWSVFCSIRVYIILHSLPILLVKIGLCLSVFWFFRASVS